MPLRTHIINDIAVFAVEDSISKIVDFFHDSTYSHVAVTEKNQFLGVLSDEDVHDFEADKKLADYRYNMESFFVRKETNWLDVLETFARNEANLIPILNEQNEVLGYYDLTDICAFFINTPFFTEPGGIIVLASGIKDYSFSEIAQIVESNNTRVIGAFITDIRNDVIQITLKIGTTDLNEVLQTFRRYNYNVLFGNHDDQFIEDLKQRSDYLEKYLNV
ncbi:CBS domain-containing protein [Aurantibacter crassamenti]|uniref:CBS domain-containing protein n=1 Tax=Aurantibacter crassamenti TaxID=1837375 RepID=UPI0019399C2A|nr:CBS domain-containing protein [Aurantibacter crassamenti]MBM1106063.1 CBS domain-containing protein [Aurantibacter crassamenti]